MKHYITLVCVWFLIHVTSSLYAQIMVTGTVIDRYSHESIPGVMVMEIGTDNNVYTNEDGQFSITVTNTNAMLEFTFIGYQPYQVNLNGRTVMDVMLKLDCNIDFFDAYDFSISVVSGLVHTPVGGQLYISSPYTAIGVVKGTYRYQTDTRQNTLSQAEIELSHPIVTCDFQMDFRWSNRYISFNDRTSFNANSLEAQLQHRRMVWMAGFSHLNVQHKREDEFENSPGMLFGVGKHFFMRPLQGMVAAKVAFYKGQVEYQGLLNTGYKRFDFFMRYYKLDSFDELSVGVGVRFNYYKPKA